MALETASRMDFLMEIPFVQKKEQAVGWISPTVKGTALVPANG